MNRRRAAWGVAATVLVAASWLPAGPARADWLQMKDGSRVETKGGWEVRGAQVVFTLPNGTLASARTAQVDLEASQRLTAESKAPPPASTPVPPRKPVLVLTDADVGHFEAAAPAPRQSPQTAEAGKPAAAPAAGDKPAAEQGLQVTEWNWRYVVAERATVVSGSLKNPASVLVYSLKLVVGIYDGGGGLLAKSDATLGAPGLPPGGSTTWEVRFPGVYDVKDAKFEASAVRMEQPATTPASGGSPAPPAEPTAAPTPTATTAAPASAGDAAGERRLEVSRWQPERAAGSSDLSVVGELTNHGSDVAYDVKLLVTVLDAGGASLANGEALVGSTVLAPGQSTSFRVSFPGVESYQNVRFDARHNVRTAVRRTVPAQRSGL